MEININESIKVKLNDKGKDIYYHQFDELNKSMGIEFIKPSFPKVDEKGYSVFQLWTFMQLYGKYLKLGEIAPFDTNIIIKE